MTKWMIAFGLCVALVAIVIFKDRLFPQTEGPITARIELENTCALPDSDFALLNRTSGRYAKFTSGTATVTAPYNTKFKLVLAPKYDDVEFDGTDFFLRGDRTVTADCGNSEKQRGVMGGLKGQFGN